MVEKILNPYPRQKIPEPIVKRYGKETSIYKEIQGYTEDADFYSCMEKYGSIERIETDREQLYQDVTAIQEDNQPLDIFTQQKKIKEIWDTLPADIKQECDFDVEKLPEVAKNWLTKQAQKQTQVQEPTKATETETQNA